MNSKKLVVGAFIILGSFLQSCNNEEAETKKEEQNESVNHEVSLETDEEQSEYTGYSVQEQWDDIVGLIKQGDKEALSIYVDELAPTFSEQEWAYLDFSEPEYAKAFSAYKSFDDLPEADYFADGAKVLTVGFIFEEEDMTFESTAMIYFTVADGLIWIIGSAMAG